VPYPSVIANFLTVLAQRSHSDTYVGLLTEIADIDTELIYYTYGP